MALAEAESMIRVGRALLPARAHRSVRATHSSEKEKANLISRLALFMPAT
jgi:hypothetical protein